MTRQQVLDLYFLDARHKLIEIAAFLDRAQRAPGKDDFRLKAFRNAAQELNAANPHRARNVLLRFSDPTTKPIPAATTKAACGAFVALSTNLAAQGTKKSPSPRRSPAARGRMIGRGFRSSNKR